MNRTENSTAETTAPAPYRWEAKHPAEAAMIRKTETIDLTILADAFGAGVDALVSIVNQPRCGENSGSYLWIDEEIERLGNLREMIFEEIRQRPSDGDHSYEEAIRKLLAYDLADCGEGFMEAMATMSRMVSAHESKCGEIKRVAMGMAA